MSKKLDEKRYEVIVQEDENGDYLVPIPPILLEQLGWKEGDDVEFSIENGQVFIKKHFK